LPWVVLLLWSVFNIEKAGEVRRGIAGTVNTYRYRDKCEGKSKKGDEVNGDLSSSEVKLGGADRGDTRG